MGLTIEELNYTTTVPRDSFIQFDEFSLHTARCHWWIIGPIRIILMIDNSKLADWKELQSIERNFDDICDGDHDISHYQIELNLWGHTNKGIDLGLHNWASIV